MKYVLGDLIKMADEGQFDIICHGCNIHKIMGAGIAASIRKRAPQAYEADCKTIKGDRNKLGNYTKAIVDDMYSHSPYTIVNAYTQATCWDVNDMLSYDAVRDVMRRIKNDFDSDPNHIPRIGIPLVGAGLALGDWNRIEEIIKSVRFRDLTVVIWNEMEALKVNRLQECTSQ